MGVVGGGGGGGVTAVGVTAVGVTAVVSVGATGSTPFSISAANSASMSAMLCLRAKSCPALAS